jgi:hypothetical protein
VSNETLKCVCYAHFQSIMNYGIILWGHSSGCQRLFQRQKKVIRLLLTSQGKEKGFLQTAVHTTEDALSVFIVRV